MRKKVTKKTRKWFKGKSRLHSISECLHDDIASFGEQRYQDGYLLRQEQEAHDKKLNKQLASHRLEPIVIALERSMESLARIGLVFAKALENEK